MILKYLMKSAICLDIHKGVGGGKMDISLDQNGDEIDRRRLSHPKSNWSHYLPSMYQSCPALVIVMTTRDV